MPDLKLGPLPKVRYVRRSIKLPETLDAELVEYARLHSQLYEPVEVNDLIPHMLEDHLRSDRGWRTHKAKQDRTIQRPKPAAEGTRRTDSGTSSAGPYLRPALCRRVVRLSFGADRSRRRPDRKTSLWNTGGEKPLNYTRPDRMSIP